MTVEFKEPPERRRKVFTQEVLAELRAKPGEWALIRTYYGSRGVYKPKHPPDIELMGYAPADRCELYARAKPHAS